MLRHRSCRICKLLRKPRITPQELTQVVRAYDRLVRNNRSEKWDTIAEVIKAENTSEVEFEIIEVAVDMGMVVSDNNDGGIDDEVWAMVAAATTSYQEQLQTEFPELLNIRQLQK